MTDFSIKYNSEAGHYDFIRNGKELTAKGSKFANIQNNLWDFILEKQKNYNWDGLVEEIVKQCNDREINLTFQGIQNDFKTLEDTVNLYQGNTVFHLHFEAMHSSYSSAYFTEKSPKTTNHMDRKPKTKPCITKQRKETNDVTNFSIKYNPYLVECEFKKNGRKLTAQNSKFSEMSNKRLQFILGEHKAQGWRGLPQEIAATCNDNVINLDFQGRKIDYDDLQYTIKKYQEDCKANNQRSAEFKITFNESKNDNDIITELDKIIAEIKQKNLPQFNQTNRDGKTIFDAYEEAKNGILKVSVIATMSSGKSTLINSLLHTELLPSSNAACTATVAAILDNDDMKYFEAKCLDANNKVVYPRDKIDAEIMSKYNSDEKVHTIAIEGSIPAIPSDKIRICLYDTPGPNNSRNKHHKKLTESIITQNTNYIVVYVMNTTQMETNDDKSLFESISREMKKKGKQSHDRFIFVVNKCDALDPEKGEKIPDLLNKARDYLKQFDISDPILIPTNSLLALTIRKKLNGQTLTRSENKNFNDVDDYVKYEDLHYEDFAVLTPSVRDLLKRKVTEYHANKDNWVYEALIHTGIPALEETITEYVEKYAYPIKINDAVKDIIAIFDEIGMKADFEKQIANDKMKLMLVQEQIKEATLKHEKSKLAYNKYCEKISNFTIKLNQTDEKKKIDRELNNMTKKYDNQTSVDKSDAEYIIHSFQKTLETFQNACAYRLTTEINDNLFNLGEKMLDEYRQEIKCILSDMTIDGFIFNKISSFKNIITINNIDEIIRNNETDKFETVQDWRDNPDRKSIRIGFITLSQFWKPKQIEYTKYVKTGTLVNVRNVIIDVIGEFGENLYKSIDQMFSKADTQIYDYKRTFRKNINELHEEIEHILNQLKTDTENSHNIEECLIKNEELYEWADNKENAIKLLLNI